MNPTVASEFFKGPITCCEYFNNNLILAGCGPLLNLIDSKTLETLSKIEILKYGVLHGLRINSETKEIYVFGQKTVSICYLDTEKQLFHAKLDFSFEFDDWIWEIQVLKNRLALVTAHNRFILFDLSTNTVSSTQDCSQKCMLYSAKIIDYSSSVLVASGTIFNHVLVWDSNTGDILLTLSGHEGVIFSIGFHYSENLLYSVSDDRSIIVWRLDLNESISMKAKLLTRFFGHEARIWSCVCFKALNKTYLCSTGEDLKCCIWNVDEQKCVYKFSTNRKGSKNIWCLALNEENYEIVTGWLDGGLRKYELKHYLIDSNQDEGKLDFENEHIIDYRSLSDHFKCFQIIGNNIVMSTNEGNVFYLHSSNGSFEQKLIFHDSKLISYSCMAKFKQKYVAIGSLNGSIYFLYEINDQNLPKFKCFESSSDQNNRKILNIQFQEYDSTIYLLASFTFLNGLIKLYKIDEKNLDLIIFAQLYLPACKHRWFSSFALTIQESCILIFVGDKCGNLHLYHHMNEALPSEPIKPTQTLTKVTKSQASIQAIYYKNEQLVCCSKDGFYSFYEMIDGQLSFVNKYEINSAIDLIEAMIFNETLHDPRLAFCFYGEKFLLWSFLTNRAMMEVKCGGANRVWDYEIIESCSNQQLTCRFVYQKQKNLVRVEKSLNLSEIIPSTLNSTNHLIQVFHGNNITCGKFFKSYFITGSEDTRVIISKIKNLGDAKNPLSHEFYLPGHDSVVKCIDHIEINQGTYLLLTAGGKANLKLWEIIVDCNETIKQVVQKCEFKRFFMKSKPLRELDVRFMSCFARKLNSNEYLIYIACSDGSIKVFKYFSMENKIELYPASEYNRCLLAVKHLKQYEYSDLVMYSATDGCLFIEKIDSKLKNSHRLSKFKIHHGGINSFDIIWLDALRENALVGTVGDDGCVVILLMSHTNGDKIVFEERLRYNTAHASSIMGIKFLSENYIVTVAKDQRLVLWSINSKTNKIDLIKVLFINVADISSIDISFLYNGKYRILIVGNGFEIIQICI